MQKIKDDYAEAGDLGNVAAAARAKQKTMFKPKPLTVQGVFKCASLAHQLVFFFTSYCLLCCP